MIAYLNGLLAEKKPTYFIMECSGVGYKVLVSLSTFEKSTLNQGEKGLLIIQQIIKEDKHLLYGFYSEEEKNIFNRLIEVSGVGTNTAMVILSSLSVDEVKSAILNSSQETFKSVKGIGAKTAQRIIIDLKDKITTDFYQLDEKKVPNSNNNIKQDALNALVSLGFSKQSVEKIFLKIFKSQDIPRNTEELIKTALKLL